MKNIKNLLKCGENNLNSFYEIHTSYKNTILYLLNWLFAQHNLKKFYFFHNLFQYLFLINYSQGFLHNFQIQANYKYFLLIPFNTLM